MVNDLVFMLHFRNRNNIFTASTNSKKNVSHRFFMKNVLLNFSFYTKTRYTHPQCCVKSITTQYNATNNIFF